MSDFIDSAKSLHTVLVDSAAGYQEALEDAEGRGLSGLFREMIALRSEHHRELDQILRAAGAQPDESRSFMETVHRTVMKVRSLFGGLDESVLPGLIDGEERVVGYYDDVLKTDVPAAARATLTKQRERVKEKIAAMSAMKASA